MSVEAVFFDVDDTLVDFDTAARASFATVFGSEADYALWLSLDHYRRFESGELGFEEMRELRMADFLAMIGRESDVPRAADLERQRFEGLVVHYRLFDDVPACLAALRERGLRLGVITNNVADHQRHKMAAVSLGSWFDTVVISGEVGVAKPAAAIFARACDSIGVRPEAAMHVGDRLDVDAAGARDAGLRGVWLDRRGEYDGTALGVDVIGSLAELPDLLR